MDFIKKYQYANQLFDNIIEKKVNFYEFKHPLAILKGNFIDEWIEILEMLNNLQLYYSDIIKPGGRKSSIAEKIDNALSLDGWKETKFNTNIVIDNTSHESPTHKIDCYKKRIAFEIEWNNKDPFYDRDLNNFRLLHELDVISVGIILTRSSELQKLFVELKKGKSYGNSTTHVEKLIPRLIGRGNGGCPVLVLAIRPEAFIDDRNPQ